MYSTNKRILQIVGVLIFFAGLYGSVTLIGQSKNDVDTIIGILPIGVGIALMIICFKWAKD